MIELDAITGKITTTFDDLPQFPVSDLQLELKSGARAALVNPSTCGAKTITATYYSWQDPEHAAHLHQLLPDHPKARRLAVRERPQRTAVRPAAVGGHLKPARRRLLAVHAATDENRRRPGDLHARRDAAPGRLAKIAGVGTVPGDWYRAGQDREGRAGRARAGRPLLSCLLAARHDRWSAPASACR